MEFLETLKDFFAMLYFLFSSLPKEFQIGIIAVIVLALLMTCGLSKTCDKKKKKEEIKEKSENNQSYESMNQPINNKSDNDIEVEDDIPSFSFTALEEDFPEEIEKISMEVNEEKYSLPSMTANKKIKSNEEMSGLDIVVEDELFDNIQLDNFHKIDHLYLSSKGLFLIFSMKLNAKTAYGDPEDEYLFFDGERRLNPLFQKTGYIKKINKFINIDINKISIVVISSEIEFAQSSLPIFNNLEDFKSTLKHMNKIMKDSEMEEIKKSSLIK